MDMLLLGQGPPFAAIMSVGVCAPKTLLSQRSWEQGNLDQGADAFPTTRGDDVMVGQTRLPLYSSAFGSLTLTQVYPVSPAGCAFLFQLAEETGAISLMADFITFLGTLDLDD